MAVDFWKELKESLFEIEVSSEVAAEILGMSVS